MESLLKGNLNFIFIVKKKLKIIGTDGKIKLKESMMSTHFDNNNDW